MVFLTLKNNVLNQKAETRKTEQNKIIKYFINLSEYKIGLIIL